MTFHYTELLSHRHLKSARDVIISSPQQRDRVPRTIIYIKCRFQRRQKKKKPRITIMIKTFSAALKTERSTRAMVKRKMQTVSLALIMIW